jgi:tRNA(Leu) C34 or U34 (ribose-2'-O)-methylase TrmL
MQTVMRELIPEFSEGEVKLKEWECVHVSNHKDVGKTIEEWQKKGWSLHTYACSQYETGNINHYLLFERETGS